MWKQVHFYLFDLQSGTRLATNISSKIFNFFNFFDTKMRYHLFYNDPEWAASFPYALLHNIIFERQINHMTVELFPSISVFLL